MSTSPVTVVLLSYLTFVFEREVGELAGTSNLLVSGPLWLITASIDVIRFLLCTTHCCKHWDYRSEEADTGRLLRELAIEWGGEGRKQKNKGKTNRNNVR